MKLSQAVRRGEISRRLAKTVVDRLISQPTYSVDDAYVESVEKADFEHTLDQLALRVLTKLQEAQRRGYTVSPQLKNILSQIATIVRRLR